MHGSLIAPPTIAHICDTLEYLSFGWNRIRHVTKNYFDGCHLLVAISLEHNRLRSFPDVSSIANNVCGLVFSHNIINDIETLHVYEFPQLYYLFLRYNQISSFVFHYHKMPRLEKLDLEHNNLSNLSDLGALVVAPKPPGWVSSRVSKLAYNPWNCNKESAWIFSMLHREGQIKVDRCTFAAAEPVSVWSHTNLSGRLCNVHQIICASPHNMAGCRLMDAGKFGRTPWFSTCRRPFWLTSSGHQIKWISQLQYNQCWTSCWLRPLLLI